MSMAVASGFAILALLGGYSIKLFQDRNINFNFKKNDVKSEIKEPVKDDILAESIFLWSPWYLLANGKYYNSLTGEITSKAPKKGLKDDNKEDDKKKDVTPLVSAGKLSGVLLGKVGKYALWGLLAVTGYIISKNLNKEGK